MLKLTLLTVLFATAPASPSGPTTAPASPSGPPTPAAAVAPKTNAPPAASATPRLPLKEVVERVQKRYDAAKDFRARFNQTLTNAAFARRTSSAGEGLLHKTGRMRWDYTQPHPQMYFAHRTTPWPYAPLGNNGFKQ